MTTDKKTRNTENYKGNTNAVKGSGPATTHIHLRTEPARKTRYVWQAEKEGLRLSEWMTKHLDKVCDDAGTPIPERHKVDD